MSCADMENFIVKYYQQIKDGSITAGKYIVLAYTRLVHGMEDGAFVYVPKKAHAAVNWIEQNCFHTEGDLATKPLKLALWQKAMVSAIFGIEDHNGNRQFREVFLVVGRKNGKSLLSAAIARYIWKTGGFGTRVYNLAPKLDQASLVYDSIWNMTLLDPDYQERRSQIDELREKSHGKVDDSGLEKHRQTDLYIASLNSTVKKIAFSSKKSDGFNPSLTIADEVASWEGDSGLKQYEVLKSGMGARSNSILLSCTTSGYVNDSIYDELMKRSTRFLLGESKETRLLPIIYMIDDIEKWNDLNELEKSNPNLGVSVTRDYLLEEIAIAEGSFSKATEFKVKYCNIKQNSSIAWLRSVDVNKCVGEPLELNDFRGCYCVGGIDLSRTTDLTAACIVIEKNEKLCVFAKAWLPAERIDDATAKDGLPYRAYIARGLLQESGENFVDYHDCFDWFRSLIENYEIYPLKIGYDRYNSQYLTQEMKNYGFHMDDVYQGENLSPVIDETEGLIRDGRINIGDNDLLRIHLLDSATKTNSETMRKRLIKVSANVHIDLTASLIDAMTVRQKWYTEIGEQLKNRG